ncbi:MAG: type IV pilus assembly protein PilM [Patescibacteria group bacterium]|nr:type IV pilus assembly protein PilM [Patescibacteria group bacterium]
MLKFFDLDPESFGLEISDLSLKVVQLEKKGKFLGLRSFGKIDIKPGVIEEGKIKNKKALVGYIKKVLKNVKGKKIKTKRVISSLPERMAFLQVIQMPKMKEKELETAVLFEAENYIPLPIEKVYLDFQVIDPFQNYLDHLNVLIAAFPKKFADPYISCIEEAGLELQALEIESQSISRSLVQNETSPFPLLIIDFGRTKTNFIVFSGHSLRFTTTIPIASENLSKAISKVFKKDLIEAEKLKIKYGLSYDFLKVHKKNEEYSENKKVFEAMVPVLSDLTEQIEKYINYYQTHRKYEHLVAGNTEIKKILLTGRGADLRELDDFLSLILRIPVELANPWINILPKPLKEVPGLLFRESIGYSTTLGLALRGTNINQ